MTTLVTGATGFLGSRLARLLVARGEPVRALVRATSDRRRLAELPIDYAVGDVTDRASVERALDGARRVFHAAALYELGTKDPARMERINVGGTKNVLDAAAERELDAVHVSSVVALGPTGSRPADETHWSGTAPRSAYEATKRAAHEHARTLAKVGAKVRIALPVTIYGPDDPSLVGLAHRALARGLFRVGAFADHEMSMVHVDDCAEGLRLIAEHGEDGAEYILSERVVTFRAWFDVAARAAGRRPPAFFVPDWVVERYGARAAPAVKLAGFSPELLREGLAMAGRWAFSGERARAELGWRPRAFERGVEQTMGWYRRERAGGSGAATGTRGDGR